MRLETIGKLPLDQQRLANQLPPLRDGRYQAVNDVSISNSLTIASNDGTIARLEQIVAVEA
jgi:hypothetical protein